MATLLTIKPELENLNCRSAVEICKSSKQIVVYGFSGCKYLQITSALWNSNMFEKIYDYKMSRYPKVTSLEGRVINSFCSGNDMKATLVNVVFENNERKKLGLPLIPVLFCVDIDDNEYPLTAQSLCTRKKPWLWTNSELRRSYKLCCEFEDPEIRQAAQETFKYVKLTQSKANPGSLELQEIDPPWKSKEWDAAWAERKATKVPEPRKSFCNKKGKSSDWRADLRKAIKGPSFCERLTTSAKDALTSFSEKMRTLNEALAT